MDRVRPAVAGAIGYLLGLDRVHELGLSRIGLGVEDVDPRGAQARNEQVATFQVGMGGVRAERGAARVPAEVVELVAHVRRLDAARLLAVAGRLGVDVERHQSIGLFRGRVEGDHVGKGFDRRFRRQARRRIEGLVGSK